MEIYLTTHTAMQPTEITTAHGRKLIVVEVPVDAHDFEFDGNIGYYSKTISGGFAYIRETSGLGLLLSFPNNGVIIGTLHYNPEPVFDFDTEQFVEYTDILMDIIGREYKEYSVKDCSIFSCMTANESSLSLLHSYGIGFKENPLGRKPIFDGWNEPDLITKRFPYHDYLRDMEAWQKAEEGVLRPDKKLVFIEVKP